MKPFKTYKNKATHNWNQINPMQNMKEHDMMEMLLTPQRCMGASALGVHDSPWSRALRSSNILSAF